MQIRSQEDYQGAIYCPNCALIRSSCARFADDVHDSASCAIKDILLSFLSLLRVSRVLADEYDIPGEHRWRRNDEQHAVFVHLPAPGLHQTPGLGVRSRDASDHVCAAHCGHPGAKDDVQAAGCVDYPVVVPLLHTNRRPVGSYGTELRTQ